MAVRSGTVRMTGNEVCSAADGFLPPFIPTLEENSPLHESARGHRGVAALLAIGRDFLSSEKCSATDRWSSIT